MHIAHSITEEPVRRALGEVPMINFRHAGIQLGPENPIAVATYVDNYLVVGLGGSSVDKAAAAIDWQLNA